MTVGLDSARVSRRQLIGGAAGTLALSVAFKGTARAQQATPIASPMAGEWTFTDDKGVTITLPTQPVTIIADVNAAAPLWDFGIRPVAVFGWNANDAGEFGAAGGNVDPSQVEIIGNPAELIKLEAAAALQPDLIVTITWTPSDPAEYWSIEPEVIAQVTTIAPLAAISATGMADENTERFAELAAALGADLDSPELSAARDAYLAALDNFKAEAAAKSDLLIEFVYVDDTAQSYIASPQDWADLNLYESLGLQLVKPNVEKEAFWEEISTEEALKYTADVILTSSRLGTLSIDELKAHPTWGLHPAVKAGQVAEWNQDFIMSHQGMKAALDATIAAVTSAKKII